VLNPSPVELLVGVADGLRAEVLDALEPGPAREQLQNAIAMLRRIARALPGLVPYLVADMTDVAATLEALGEPGPHLLPDPSVAPLEELVTAASALRDRLAERIDAGGLDPDQERLVRDALARLTGREAALRLSPWQR